MFRPSETFVNVNLMTSIHLAADSGSRDKRAKEKLGHTPKLANDRHGWRTLVTALYAKGVT